MNIFSKFFGVITILGLFFLISSNAFCEAEYKEAIVKDIVQKEDAMVYSIQDTLSNVSYDITLSNKVFRGQEIEKNDRIFYSVNTENGKVDYLLHEHVRIGNILLWFFVFLAITFFITKGKSLGAFGGLFFSGGVLFLGVIPSLKAEFDPFITCFVAAIFISLGSGYFSHGIKKSTSIMLLSLWITLVFCTLLSSFAIATTNLFGFGDDSASVLIMNGYLFDFKGILLGGFLLGMVGILDDVIATQIESLAQIKASNPLLSAKELFKKAMSIGNEHIFSMINTLILVYFSASLPMFLLMFSGDSEIMMILNSEMIAEEIIRTIVGSLGIIIAVPLSTIIGIIAIEKKFF